MEFPYGHGHHHHHHRPETNELDRDSYPPPPQPGQYQPPYGYDGPPPPQPGPYQPPYGYDGPPPSQPGQYQSAYGYDGPPPQPGHYRPPYGYDGPPPPQPGQYQPPYGYDGPPPPPPAQHQQPFGYDGPPPGHLPYGGVGGGDGYNRLPPTVHQFGGGGGYGGPDNSSYGGPPPPAVEHVSHEGGGGGFFGHHLHHHSRPQEHGGSYVQHVGKDGGSAGQKPTVRIYTKAEENYSLSVRDGNVVLAKADNTDPYQHWIKDLKYSTKVKDEEGFPSFSLVNKVTGEALKHSIGATHPVRLVPYNADYLDESVLWTESKDLGDGFRCIRMVNNIRLNFDAFHGDEDHGGVHDGTTLVLWEWLKGKNQRWKIVPY